MEESQAKHSTNINTRHSHTKGSSRNSGKKEKRVSGPRKGKGKGRKQDRTRKSTKTAARSVQAKANHAGGTEVVASDMRSRGVSIACLQETQSVSEYSS